MEELVEVPGRSGTRRDPASFACALTLAVLVGTALVDTLSPIAPRRPVGAEAVELAILEHSKQLRDGSQARWFERKLEGRSRVRNVVSSYLSVLLLKAFDVGSRSVIVGKDHWLFMPNRVGMDRRRFERGVKALPRVLVAVERRLRALNCELVLLPVPRKAVACREHVPAHLSVDPSLDSELIHALQDQGLVVADVLGSYLDTGSAEPYLRLDSHWSWAGQLAMAEAVAECRPDLARVGGPISLPIGQMTAKSGILALLGVDRRTRAMELLGEPQMSHVIRGEAYGPGEGRLGEAPPELASARQVLAGSSFTSGFDIDLALGACLAQPVACIGHAGGPMLAPIASVIDAREGGVLPETLLYEFPVYQAPRIVSPRGGVFNALSRLFTVLQPPHVEVLRELDDRVRAQPKGGRVRAVWPPGTLLSSGDGVMGIRVTAKGEEPTIWELGGSARGIRFQLGPESPSLVVPLLDFEGHGGQVQLFALDAAARAAEIDLDVVAEISTATAVQLDAESPRIRRATKAVPIQRGDALILRGMRPGGAATVEAVGVRADGEPATASWAFPRIGSGVCVLDLGHFLGGEVETVRFSRALPGVTAALGGAGVR